jgi:hypothetical protein
MYLNKRTRPAISRRFRVGLDSPVMLYRHGRQLALDSFPAGRMAATEGVGQKPPFSHNNANDLAIAADGVP